MWLWWGKPSSKDLTRKTSRGSIFDVVHRKLKSGLQYKNDNKAGGSERFTKDDISQKDLTLSRSALTSLQVSRCPSFAKESHAQPLPPPESCLLDVGDAEFDCCTSRLELQGRSKPLPIPICGHDPEKLHVSDTFHDLATASASSRSSLDTNDKLDSQLPSPFGSDYESGYMTAVNSPSRNKDLSPTVKRRMQKEQANDSIPITPARRQGCSIVHMSKLQIPSRAGFFSSPDTLISSPKSPVRSCGHEKVIPCSKTNSIAPGRCSSPGSVQTLGYVYVKGDMPLFVPQSSPDCSPMSSPKIASSGPGSRLHSVDVTPLHPPVEFSLDKPGDGKLRSHRLPLPPATASMTFLPSYSTITTSLHLRNPGCWKKGCLIGSGTFGLVYKGFNSESGETCAMKEVTIFSDDAKSKENLEQLRQEITLLSCLRHPNIVRYFGSEKVDDKLYIYLEYVSGGSINKILQEYGQLGEKAIRSYTQQILLGLAYLHAKNIVHRDIKGANILVDPNGSVKLADFGMAKHITGHSCPLSFRGSPYWMAPEVIRNFNGYSLAVDIWSLGCTVLEMATSKPPWSQYEGVAALFKIGNSKELPAIPDHLSEEGKDFVKKCLQRNPLDRPTAAQLLEHPFVKNVAFPERLLNNSQCYNSPHRFTNTASLKDMDHRKKFSHFYSEGSALRLLSGSKIGSKSKSRKSCMPKHVSCPVSPIGSPVLCARSSQTTCRMKSTAISIPLTVPASSATCTSGNGAVPIHHSNNSRVYYSYEGVGFQWPQKNLYAKGKNPLCTRLTSETRLGIPESREKVQSLHTQSNLQSSHFVQLVHQGQQNFHDRHSALSTHVSQQLLMSHLRVNQRSDSSVL